MSLTIRDDGAGFDSTRVAETVPRTSGVGLAGMHERAKLADGTLTVDSAPGKGTTVRVEVPIAPNE